MSEQAAAEGILNLIAITLVFAATWMAAPVARFGIRNWEFWQPLVIVTLAFMAGVIAS